jgi:hypothetical protein
VIGARNFSEKKMFVLMIGQEKIKEDHVTFGEECVMDFVQIIEGIREGHHLPLSPFDL